MNLMRSNKVPKPGYPLNQSPLFRLLGKEQFEKVIGVKWDSIDELLSPDNFRVWTNTKGREIQQPVRWLGAVHQRIGRLLSRIELPSYVFSRKGRSYIDNAREHLGNTPLVKTDIHKFYPSTTHEMIYRLFVDEFQCAKDIARHLAGICCYKQLHLPTGSPLSGRLAFFSAKRMFDEIARLAAADGCKMTLYVDDITISGQAATKRILGSVRQGIHRFGLKTKQAKSKTFAGERAKTVTGVVVNGSALCLPNARHKSIAEARKKLRSGVSQMELDKLKQTLQGRLIEARQVLPASKARSKD
jgi:hypothetical protein